MLSQEERVRCKSVGKGIWFRTCRDRSIINGIILCVDRANASERESMVSDNFTHWYGVKISMEVAKKYPYDRSRLNGLTPHNDGMWVKNIYVIEIV